MVLAGVQPNLDPENVILGRADSEAQAGEEFLVAFKVDAGHFKIVRRIGPYAEDETYPIA